MLPVDGGGRVTDVDGAGSMISTLRVSRTGFTRLMFPSSPMPNTETL